MSQRLLRPRRRQRNTALIVLLVVLILLLAAVLRFNRLDAQSLWADEGNSAAMAGRSPGQIALHAANDIHPPLYYWLLKLWTGFAGTSEAGLRSLSALLGVLLVLGTIGLGMRMGGALLGLVAGLIAALSPLEVYYSQEARMYLLLALEAAAAAYGFWWLIVAEDRELNDPKKANAQPLKLWPTPFFLLALVFSAGLYTHYLFPLMIGVLSLLYLAWIAATRARGAAGRRVLRWAILCGVALLSFIPWLSIAFRQITHWPTATRTADLGAALQAALTMLNLGPVGQHAAAGWWVWALTALALLGAMPWPAACRRPAWLCWLLPVAWAIAPLGTMAFFGLFREAYLKFLLIASPAYALLMARGAVGPAFTFGRIGQAAATTEADQPRAVRIGDLVGTAWCIAALSLTVALFGINLDRYFRDPKTARDDYRGIAEFIAVTADPNDAVLLVAPGQSEVFRYYYKGDLPIYALPRQRPMDADATVAELSQLLARDKVFAVYWATQEADPGNLIQTWLNNRGYKTLDQWRGNVRLVVYVMPERRPTDEVVSGLNLSFGPDIVLRGYRSGNLNLTAGEVTQLQLVWQAVGKPARRYKVFMQLLDAHEQVIAQRDAEPVGDGRPTNTWEPGETIVDNHGVLIPPGTPPGDYRRIIGLYDRETGERLRLPDGKDHLDLAPVRVNRSLTAPPLAALNMMYEQRFDFGAISLLGYDRYKRGYGHAPETPLYPGDRLHLTFYWQANVRPRAAWWFSLTLSDSSGHAVANLRWPLVSDAYPTTAWMKGEVVRGEHDLQIASETPPGDYRLSLTLLPDDETEVGTAYLGTVKISDPRRQRNPQ
jgi:mannosyltransferase